MSQTSGIEADEREVLAVNDAFYRALESLDLAEMEAVWWHEDWVRCLHPGWELLEGWEAVEESWANIFRSTVHMRVFISRPLVRVVANTAWVSCVEHVTSAFEADFATARIEATNIFVRCDGEWRMVHHHTTPLPDRAPSGTVHSVQ